MTRSFAAIRARRGTDPARRARVEEHKRAIRDAQRLGRQLDLGVLREARGVTQTAVAREMGASQPNISRIERQEDLYLSTLEEYVAALGGHLEVNAVFPDGIIALVAPGASLPGEEPIIAGGTAEKALPESAGAARRRK
jgi:transcriptional regulator with XRE-family HTH domain